MNIKSAFAKRVIESGLTLKDAAWIANVSYKRIRQHSEGKLELTAAELERVNAAVSRAAVVSTIYQRALDEAKTAIKIATVDGVITVEAMAEA